MGVERLSFQNIEMTAIWIPGRTKVNSKKRKYRKMKARKQTRCVAFRGVIFFFIKP